MDVEMNVDCDQMEVEPEPRPEPEPEPSTNDSDTIAATNSRIHQHNQQEEEQVVGDSSTSSSFSINNNTEQLEEEKLRNGRMRMVALESVRNDAARVWKFLRPEYQQDVEFILTALQYSPSLPSKSEFERTFPQSLRFSKPIVLAFCSRPDFADLYYSRHLYVPDCLTNDKDVMLAYCSKIPRSLQECSEDLCNDRDIVEAAISVDGLELQYASLQLQQTKEIVQLACAKDGNALEFCPPGPVRDELTSDRGFMYSILANNNGGSMLRLVSEENEFHHDRDMLLQAITHGLRFRYVPVEYQTDKEFLIQALNSKSTLYLEIASSWQHDPEIALAAILAEDSTPHIHEKAISQCPSLTTQRPAILAICQRGERSFIEQLLTKPETEQFRDDKEIMLKAIAHDVKLFRIASPRLQQDPDIILESIQESSAWSTLRNVPSSIQRMYPQITIKAITKCCIRSLRYLQSHIPDDLWNQEAVILAWLRRGGRVLETFERTLSRNETLALALAQYNWSEFYKVDEVLLCNARFMSQAVQRDGRVLRFASHELRQSFPLIVAAIANHKNAINVIPGIDSMAIKERIQSQLQIHKSFVQDFLRGIAIVTQQEIPPSKRSQLPMLDRGMETSQAFKQLIAEYVGVPTGSKLRLLRTAWDHLDGPSPSSTTTPISSSPDTTTATATVAVLGNNNNMNMNMHINNNIAGGDAPRRARALRRLERFQRRHNNNNNNNNINININMHGANNNNNNLHMIDRGPMARPMDRLAPRFFFNADHHLPPPPHHHHPDNDDDDGLLFHLQAAQQEALEQAILADEDEAAAAAEEEFWNI